MRHPIFSSLPFLTSISLSLQYVLYTSTTIFLVGSALCGAAQVSPFLSSGSPLYEFPMHDYSLMIHTSFLGHAVAHHSPGSRGSWGWWHCKLCVDHNDRNRAPRHKGKVVPGSQCDVVCFCRCRSDLGRRLLRWASLPRQVTALLYSLHTGLSRRRSRHRLFLALGL